MDFGRPKTTTLAAGSIWTTGKQETLFVFLCISKAGHYDGLL